MSAESREEPVAVIGLGNMGGALAANLVDRGLAVVGFDAAGVDRAPEGVRFLSGVHEVAGSAGVVVLSLPDGDACLSVAQELVGAPTRSVRHVVDTSTIGVGAAVRVAAALAADGIGYVDAPVSGGPAGARARTLAIMSAGSDDAISAVEATLAALTDRRFRVGSEPGMGQAMKLANNFVSATALASTSEAVAFGVAAGLDMAVMLEVLDASSGRSSASGDKFPNHVLTGAYASGFSNLLMRKDVDLYLQAVDELGGTRTISSVTADVWRRFAAAEPGVDFTRIYPFTSHTEH